MGEESETAPHIVVKDGKSSAYFSTGLDSKTSQYAVPFVAGAIQELGYKRILMKSDNEPAIKRLKERVSECLPGVESTETIGPVLEVTTSYLYGKHGVEIRIWSLNEDKSHSWVRISHGSNKFVIDSNFNNTEVPSDLFEEQTSQLIVKDFAARSKEKAKPQRRESVGNSPSIIPINEKELDRY